MSCRVRYSACPSIILRQCLSFPPRTKVDSHAIIQKGQISVIDGRHEKNYWGEKNSFSNRGRAPGRATHERVAGAGKMSRSQAQITILHPAPVDSTKNTGAGIL